MLEQELSTLLLMLSVFVEKKGKVIERINEVSCYIFLIKWLNDVSRYIFFIE